MEYMNKIKAAVIALFGTLSSWLGSLALPFGLLVVANLVDYATGLVAAPYRNEPRSSYKGMRGIAKKVCMWLLVGVGVILDTLLAYCTRNLGWSFPINFLVGCIVAVWLLTNELISIIENISDIGVDIPPFLVPVVRWVKQKAESSMQEYAGESGRAEIPKAGAKPEEQRHKLDPAEIPGPLVPGLAGLPEPDTGKADAPQNAADVKY